MINIVAVILFHNQNNSNCFLSLENNVSNNKNGQHIGTFRINKDGKSLVLNGYSIDNAEKDSLSKGKHCYIYINSILGNIYNFHHDDIVEVEFIDSYTLINADRVVLKPKTDNDYKIIDETSSLIESIFLDQVSVLENNMEFILWIQDNIFVSIIVKNIEAKSISLSGIYHLNNTTEIVVEMGTKKQHKSTVDKELQINDNISNFLTLNQKNLKDKVYRILNKHNYSHSTILVSDSTISYGLYIVNVVTLNLSFYGCLKNLPFMVPEGHCLLPSHINAREFTNILVNTISFNKIQKLNEIILLKNENCNDRLYMKDEISRMDTCLNFSSEYSAIVIDKNGINIQKNNEKIIFDVDKYSNIECGYFFTDSIPKITINYCLKLIPNKEEKNEMPMYTNFGKEFQGVKLFDYQKKIIEKLLTYYQLIMEPDTFSNIMLITGAIGSGKSTIISQFSKELFDMKYVFSKIINCYDFRGKNPSYITEEFKKSLAYLQTTFPSLLLVDNIDSIILKINDEERIRSRKKLIKDIFYLMKSSKIPILLTSYSKDLISFIESESTGFLLDEINIPQLSQVCLFKTFF